MTRLFRCAASCLATALLATACIGGDPVSPTDAPELAPSLQLVRGDTLAKKQGTTSATTTTNDADGGCALADSDSTATPADTTSTDDCFGDTLPWGRGGDTLPWGK